MRILLDTHAFLWWDNDLDRLSARARSFCFDPNNTLVLSVVSVWEMQIKHQSGKLTLRTPLAELIFNQQRENGIEILPVTMAHVFALENLPPIHKDPFDRLLIAQSIAENIGLLSVDAVFKNYPIMLLN